MAGTRQNRRVIQEDGEDDAKNDERIPDSGGEKVAKSSTSSLVDRLKRRAAKSAEAAQEKRTKLQKEEEKEKSPVKSPIKVKTEKSIPKKAKKVLTIPKKLVDSASGTNSNSEADNSKKGKPSLLSEMKKPDLPKMDTGNKGKDRSFLSSLPQTNNNNRSVSGSRKSPPHSAPLPPASTPSRRPETVILTHSPGPTEPTPSGPVVEGGKEDKLGSGLRQLVWDGLKDLCKDTFAKPPERNGVDLFASFLRHKDLKPTTIKTGNGGTDGSNNLRYDFFDTDATTGDIVLQPKIPIFPEEFPQGTREWPLSWWGIIDPAIEKENAETKKDDKSSADTTKRTKTRPEHTDEDTDRKRRTGHRSTHKRSSRDRHEDDYDHHGERDFREDRRDRYPVGESSGGRIRQMPPPRDSDRHYDRNEPLDGYPPGSRNLDHRGGGPPFPRRMDDGPGRYSRPYPNDGPPPGDYRAGPRPPPGHGGGPPRDYPRRDQYEPQGRYSHSPPRRHDDYRENRDRDRSRRMPYPKSARDDGRNLGQSAIRRDR